jgi:hypothetical protein
LPLFPYLQGPIYFLKAPNPSIPKFHHMCPFFHGHYSELCHTLQSPWSCTHMIPGRTGSTAGNPVSCGAQTPVDHRAPPTAHSPQLIGFPSCRTKW